MISVIGLDPGPTTGMCFLEYPDSGKPVVHLLQADADSAVWVLDGLLRRYEFGYAQYYAQIEKFVTGNGAGTKGLNADVTRRLVTELAGVCKRYDYSVKFRPASDAKNWATDKRLKAAGIIGAAGVHGKLRDAYDASRHALFCATADAHLPDPLR